MTNQIKRIYVYQDQSTFSISPFDDTHPRSVQYIEVESLIKALETYQGSYKFDEIIKLIKGEE